jgi:hypothetical protein
VIGQQLYMLFVEHGFEIEWDGTSRSRLKLMLPKEAVA